MEGLPLAEIARAIQAIVRASSAVSAWRAGVSLRTVVGLFIFHVTITDIQQASLSSFAKVLCGLPQLLIVAARQQQESGNCRRCEK
jgi:hypothetical protein